MSEYGNVKTFINVTWQRKELRKDVAIVAKEIDALIARVNAVVRSDKLMRTALTTVMAVHKPRIFQQGQDSSGNKIGTYSTEPISISKRQQARNTGKTYFKGGYSEYKRAVGKNPGFVNLRNTDQMMMDYGIVANNGMWGFGFQNQENYDKSQWMQDKYEKDIFDLSQSELDLLGTVLQAEVQKML